MAGPPDQRAFVGGRGLGVAVVASLGHPELPPLHPSQPFVLAAGPLTGTSAPSSGRFAAVAPSPLTGTISDSNAGGRFGVRLRQAGLDALVLRGRAPEWSVVVVDGRVGREPARARGLADTGGDERTEDDRGMSAAPSAAVGSASGADPASSPSVRVVPLSELWPGARVDDRGLVWSRTVSGLRNVLGPAFSLALPSVAGRNGALLASIRTDDGRNLGRGGLGAALAAKNVFAVAVAGDRPLPLADPDRFSFLVYEAEKQVGANPVTSRALPEFGTAVLMQLVHQAGALPALNYRSVTWPGVGRISGETVRDELATGRKGCFGCRIRCTPRVAQRGGPTEDRPGAAGPEYETLWALGAAVGVDDLEAIQEANRLCGEYGIDTISVGATIACAMELSEQGTLDRVLRFGDVECVLRLVKEMGEVQGFGAELAEGSARFAARYGHPEAAMHTKGLELPAYDPRGMHGQGLAYATSNRGACHLRGNMLGPEILGIPKMIDRFATRGKSGILLNLQHLSAVFDSASVCKFAGFAFGEEVLARLLSAAMGETLAAQDLLRSGERIWNLERLWNNAARFSRVDDTLPSRILSKPHTEGPSAGRTVDLEPMLDEYYRARGWDAEGRPTEAKVAALGLEDLAARLTGLTTDSQAQGGLPYPPWQDWRPELAEAERRRAAERSEDSCADTHPPEGGRHLRAIP